MESRRSALKIITTWKNSVKNKKCFETRCCWDSVIIIIVSIHVKTLNICSSKFSLMNTDKSKYSNNWTGTSKVYQSSVEVDWLKTLKQWITSVLDKPTLTVGWKSFTCYNSDSQGLKSGTTADLSRCCFLASGSSSAAVFGFCAFVK